jgi:hypothetical protein
MNPTFVSFNGFDITDPERYRRVVQRSIPFWPLEWNMVVERENRPLGTEIYRWLRDNTFKRYEVAVDDQTGLRVFAFECDEDCALFKLSF